MRVVYLDTSALVKIYVNESHSETVRRAVAEADRVTTCAVAYPEAMSAFRRLEADGVISREAREAHASALAAEWYRAYAAKGVTSRTAQFAGKLVFKHGLRGFDAVHLAAAIVTLTYVLGRADKDEDVSAHMLTYDKRQRKAARAEGILYDPDEPDDGDPVT